MNCGVGPTPAPLFFGAPFIHYALIINGQFLRLGNEAARAHPEKEEDEQKPLTAKDLVSALDADGIHRGTALSEAYLLGTDLVHLSDEAKW